MTDTTPMRIGAEKVLTEATQEVRSPYSSAVVGVVPLADEGHIDQAVAAALAVFREGPLPTYRRAEILDAAAAGLKRRHEEFARCITAESAKPIATSRGEVTRAIDTFAFSAAVARTLGGEQIPMDASAAGVGKFGFVLRIPIGVIGAISPFNFPLNLVAHKVAPAIAAGCPMVLKPASSTPLTALLLADLLIDECGLPPGWLSVVTAPGRVANRLVDHPDVRMITFTGSPSVGWGIRERAARKKVSLELGNNSPVIVEPDGDWERAADAISLAAFKQAGQSCISTQRVLVHDDIAERFTERLVAAVESLVVGDPEADDTQVSALIDDAETERVKSWIDEAAEQGARILTGGTVRPDGVLEPTVIADARPEMKVCAKEVFGPTVALQTYADFDEALRIANDTDFGLQAAVYTRDLATALKGAQTLDYGGVMVNEVPTYRADHMPYGGEKDAGNTREGPAYAVKEMTVERVVVIQP